MNILKALSENVLSSIQRIVWRVNKLMSHVSFRVLRILLHPFYSLQENNHSCFIRSDYLSHNHHGPWCIHGIQGQGSESFTAVRDGIGVGEFDGEGVVASVASSVPVTET